MPNKNQESSPATLNFNIIVEGMSHSEGVRGPSPRGMTEYVDAERVWEHLSPEVQALDDKTGLLDGITSKVNKYLARIGAEPTEDLDGEVARKLSSIVALLYIGPDKKLSKTEQDAIEKLTLNFSDEEARVYLGPEYIDILQDNVEEEEIKSAIPSFFSQWERLRRVASDRGAYTNGVQSVRAAAEIARDRADYMNNLGITGSSDKFIDGLSPYNLLTLTTISPKSYDTALANAHTSFALAEQEFPELVHQMPEDVMTLILRRGGSGKKQAVDQSKLFAYLARKNAALERTGSRYVTRFVGGATTEEAGKRSQAIVERGKVVKNRRYRTVVQELTTPYDFRAVDYGVDFSRTLAAIADKLPSENVPPLLEKIRHIRQLGENFSEQFENVDGHIRGEIKRAIGERITEVLYVAKHLAESDGEVSARVLGNRITVENIDEVMDALDLIETGLTRIVQAEQSGVVTASYDEENRSAWHLGPESDVLLQVKPYGEKRGEYKRGIEHSEEAQINYSVDVTSRDGEYVPISIANHRRRYALSIRLDLEGILRDDNGGKVGFDATRDQLTASLDLGSLRGSADNPNVRVARIVSLGNKLRKRELQQGRSLGYHTSLSSEYGKKERFAGLAEFKRDEYRRRALGKGAAAAALDRPSYRSSASQSEKAAA